MVENRRGVVDLWLALLAGDAVWLESDTPPGTRERAVSAFMLAALASTILTQWVALAARPDFLDDSIGDATTSLTLLAAGGLIAAVALAIRPARTALGHARGAARYWVSLAWRATAYIGLIASTAAILPSPRWLGAVPLGFVGGADALLALWLLRIRPRGAAWLRGAIVSTAHLGALGALAALVTHRLASDADSSTVLRALGAYLAMWIGIVTAGTVVMAIDQLGRIATAEREHDRLRAIAKEREQRAHWLHDDVLSEVRYTLMRVGSGGPGSDEARAELEDLDHRLRLRQLEEVVRGGGAHLYEILQPHLRRLQTLGVVVDRVPPLEVTEQRVDEATAQLLSRTVSVLTSNAVNAGARHISLYLYADLLPPSLELRVVDDAGGFDLDAVSEGRGLHTLRRDLGDHGLVREEAWNGSCMIALIPVATGVPPQLAGTRDESH